MVANAYQLGDSSDAVQIKLGDSELRTVESYTVKVSILQQPSIFSLRLGWSDTAIDLLNLAKPGTPFELRVDGRLLQTGLVDSRSAPSGASTQVEIVGRDYLAKLVDSTVDDEQSFAQKTYFELTKKVVNLAGLTESNGFYLVPLNDANRRLLTGSKLIPREDGELATELLTGALSGTGNLVFQMPRTHIGERYYDFLLRQYKLAGLFLWASPDKSLVLGRPNSTQPPSYSLYRARADSGGATEHSNVLDCNFVDDTTMRHSIITVHARSGGGKHGIQTVTGAFVDDEMQSLYGLEKRLSVHDADAKNQEQCEFVARRMISEERRAGWRLEYTVAGHTVPSPDADRGRATWGPDTVVQVADEELGMFGPFYVEACTYSRSDGGGTTTKLILMRPSDLLFATGIAGPNGEFLNSRGRKHRRYKKS